MRHELGKRVKGIILLNILIGLMCGIYAFTIKAEPLSEEKGEEILRELKEIKILLKNLEKKTQGQRNRRPTRAKVNANLGHALGKEHAPLALVEFTDYQCPYCKRFHDNVFPDFKKKYIDTGEVKYVSRDMPLGFHKQARLAAVASRCAGEQNKFWKYRSMLYANAKALSRKKVISLAKEAGMNDSFTACLDSKKYEMAVQNDIREARQAGFTGTPSFVLGKLDDKGFVDGFAIIGAKPLIYFDSKIAELKKQQKK